MRLTGFAAIEYAEKEGLTLNKAQDRIDDGRSGLSVAEAEVTLLAAIVASTGRPGGVETTTVGTV